MFRRIWSRLFKAAPVPARRACDAEIAGAPTARTGFERTASADLMGICDDYWNQLSAPLTGAFDSTPDYNRYVNAANELAMRGRDILPWAHVRLTHPEYDAREQAAYLLGVLAQGGELHNDLPSVIESLSALAVRPMKEDGKELQANTAAVIALGKTKDEQAIAPLRYLITSAEWEDDELPWDAACALGAIVNEPFEDSEDPIEAARQWLKSRKGKEPGG